MLGSVPLLFILLVVVGRGLNLQPLVIVRIVHQLWDQLRLAEANTGLARVKGGLEEFLKVRGARFSNLGGDLLLEIARLLEAHALHIVLVSLGHSLLHLR